LPQRMLIGIERRTTLLMTTFNLVYRGKEVLKKGKFDGYKLTFAFSNGSLMYKTIFKNDKKFGNVVDQLEPGDKVSVTIDDNDQYKKMIGLKLVSKGNPDGGQITGPGTGVQNKLKAGAEFRTPMEITRTEAVRLAIEAVGKMLTNPESFSVVKKSLSFDDLEKIVTEMADNFVPFITSTTQTEEAHPKSQDEQNEDEQLDDDDVPF